MPAPTRSLTVADVQRYVDEQVFRTTATGRTTERRVGIELEWLTIARDGHVVSDRPNDHPESAEEALRRLPNNSLDDQDEAAPSAPLDPTAAASDDEAERQVA